MKKKWKALPSSGLLSRGKANVCVSIVILPKKNIALRSKTHAALHKMPYCKELYQISKPVNSKNSISRYFIRYAAGEPVRLVPMSLRSLTSESLLFKNWSSAEISSS